MKWLLLTLAMIGFSPAALALCPDPLPLNTVCLEWRAPTQNVDGSALVDLDGFRIYYGYASGSYTTVPPAGIDITDQSLTDSTLLEGVDIIVPSPGLAGGVVDLYFAMTAYDTNSNESAFSNEVTRAVIFPDLLPPGAPTIITVLINVVIQ